MANINIGASILSADFSKLGSELNLLEQARADFIHIDVMDGSFVPPITFGSQMVRELRKHSSLFFDVHLMVKNPATKVGDFISAGADRVTIHREADIHIHRTLQNIKSQGIEAGIALNPSSSLAGLEYLFDYLDVVLLMSVNPGYGGQSFIENTLLKIRELCALRRKHKAKHIKIELDGGINRNTIEKCAKEGVDWFVAGSAVFDGTYENNLEELKVLANNGVKLR